MAIDDRALEGLLDESRDLDSDALRHRRAHVDSLGLSEESAARVGAVAGGLGALLAAMLAAPASAETGKDMDVGQVGT